MLIRKSCFESIKKTFRFACVHVASVASRAVLVKRWTVVLMLIQHLLPYKVWVSFLALRVPLIPLNSEVIKFLTHM